MAVIRRYRPGDLEAIELVEEECFQPHDRYGPDVILYLLSLRGSVILVAEDGGEVAGYSAGYLEPGAVGHVASVAVRPRFRRRGIGRALMEALEGELRAEGARRLRLEVRGSNAAARGLYESLGYRVVRRLPGYYGDEDGLLMEKEVG